MNEFQYRLLKVISERGITASELSEASGVDRPSLSNYINGKYEPKQDKVYKLARALDVDPGWLMTGEEPLKMDLQSEVTHRFDDSVVEMVASRLTPEDIELEDLWPSASVAARRAALAVLKSMKEGDA
jgi:transcriptional regulator with XRE-family HTH domain